ncbi:hypothetical protein GCM10023201_33470 [Actinomycetospora corticicola]|uniref:O-antigen/teichoic acid export membrane protein n=1 Tax=Actinomycetospora corticicola TaxID=663602 RepID=A0A7Y9DSE5_9PSEU|nr:hypothetical protein [Actinomycetospora corticicola]NYD34529.1 O-antigen/teichoic acid export membrane protein [Actinomycetospora corticicola]
MAALRLRRPSGPSRALVGRAFWNLVDQAISSVTNAALSVVVARSVGELDFGGFAVAFTVFSVVVGLSRNMTTSPMLIRFSGAGRDEFDTAAGGALGSALCFGFAAGTGSLAVGLLLGGVVGPSLVALGVVLPGLLVQDAWRQVFFAEGRAAAATLNDSVWAVLQVGAVALLLLGEQVDTAPPLVLAWGGAALGAAVLGRWQSRARPRPSAARRWLHDHRDLVRLMIAEFGTQQGAMQGAMLVITAVTSLQVIAVLRGSQVLLGVMNLLFTATVSFVTPEFARRRHRLSVRQWTLGAIGVFVVVGGASAVWGLLFLVLPDSVGRSLLGDTWDGVAAVLGVAVVQQVVQNIGSGPAMMLRAMDRVPVTFRLNAIQSPLAFVLGVSGAVVDGARGALVGFALAYAVVSPFWWLRLNREARRLADGGAPEAADVPAALDAPTVLVPVPRRTTAVGRLVYVVYNVNDPAVHRRVRMLRRGGVNDLVVVGFRRSSEPVTEIAGAPVVDLGRNADGNLRRRAVDLVTTRLRQGRWARTVGPASVVLARSFEALVLADGFRARHAPGGRLIYEALDVHRAQIGSSLSARALRGVEARLLARTQLLVTSSPAYVSEYFSTLGRPLPPVVVQENKVLAAELDPGLLARLHADRNAFRLWDGPPWRIGWFSQMRCARSLELLAGVCRAFPGHVEVVLRGQPIPELVDRLHATVAATPGMVFLGPYDRATDLAAIYADVHFCWGLDLYNSGTNSDWALATRLYEAGTFGCVPLGQAGVATGDWLATRGVGVLLEEPFEESLHAWASGLTRESHAAARAAMARLPLRAFVDTDDESLGFVRRLYG